MSETIVKRFTDDFLNDEVKDYATYVVQTRALPNIMDGLRVGSRKIIYAALTNKKLNPSDLTKDTEVKMPNLIGQSMDLEFNHGDVSLKNTIEQLGSRHYNKYRPLKIIGQIGSLRDPKITTAARYLKVGRQKNYLQMFTAAKEMWQLKTEDGNVVEPHHFIPVIPLSLLYRTNAPGFGFSYRCFSYNLDDVIDAILSSITTGSCTGLNYVEMRPEVDGIKQENIIYNYRTNTYYNVGEYKLTAKNQITITDLPYSVNFDAYDSYLFDLKEAGTILEYQNETYQGKIKYVITFPVGRMEILIKQKLKFFMLLKLYKKIPQSTLNLIESDGKAIVNFSNENELVDGFVRRRLAIYEDFRLRKIELLKVEIKALKTKIKFIQLIVDNIVEIRKRSKEQIIKDFSEHKIGKSEVLDNIKLPISRLSEDEITKANQTLAGKLETLDYYKKSTNRDLYINELIEFKQMFSDNKIINKC